MLVGLVRHHLLLVDVATRRDLSDDHVARGVAETVGSLERLELLAALTEADAMATGPSAWGPWKAELVAELVERVAAVLRGDDPAPAVQRQGFPDAGVRALMEAGRPVVRADPPTITVVGPRPPRRLQPHRRHPGPAGAHGARGRGGQRGRHGRVAVPRRGQRHEVDWDLVTADIRRALDGHLAIEARLAERRAGTGAAPAPDPRR